MKFYRMQEDDESECKFPKLSVQENMIRLEKKFKKLYKKN